MEEDFVCLHGAINVSAHPACANPTVPSLPPRPLDVPFFLLMVFGFLVYSLMHPLAFVSPSTSTLTG